MSKLCEVAEVLELKQKLEDKSNGEITSLGYYSAHSDELATKRTLSRKQIILQRQQSINLPTSAPPPVPRLPPPHVPAEFSNYQPPKEDEFDNDEMTEEDEQLRSKKYKPPTQQQVFLNPLNKGKRVSITTVAVEKRISAGGKYFFIIF